MATTKKTKTKKPTGLSIARNGNSYVFSWKIGDKDYGDGQSLQYRPNSSSWKSKTIGKTTTSTSVTISKNDYYPNKSTKLEKVSFRVKGNRDTYTEGSGKKKVTYKPSASDWSTKTIEIKVPTTGAVTAELSDTLENVTTFSWSIPNPSDGVKIFTRVQWQSMLIPLCEVNDGSKLFWADGEIGWQTGTSTAANSVTFTEDTALLQGTSYTRWFRMRAQGPAGSSKWTYASHVYATPYQAWISSGHVKEIGTNILSGLIKWEAQSSYAWPIDSTTLQYTIVTPEAGMKCPSGASWTDIATSADTTDEDAAAFEIGEAMPMDKFLFVRVNTRHDRRVRYGNPNLKMAGDLPVPSGMSVSADQTTKRATITATNNSTIPDSFLLVYFEYTENAKKGAQSFAIGVIPHGATSVTVQCPNWSNYQSYSFAVRAMVGSWAQQNTPNHSAVVYTYVTQSDVVRQGGIIPKAPTISLSQTSTLGTVQVKIGWEWQEANSCEISWADHEDAWESTDGPSTYKILNQAPPSWRISGLDRGKTWYVRARLILAEGDTETAGEYSTTKSINLSTAPQKPVLALSAGTIISSGSAKAVWSYVSTDDTGQALAQLAEVSTSAPKVLASVTAGQSAVVTAKMAKWAAGTTHRLAVRVMSESGLWSAWSDPVAVSVATPRVAVITQTNLVQEAVTVDDVTRTVWSLKALPLTITVTGSGTGGTTTVAIERAETYHVDRPDETDYNGFEGETVCLVSHTGQGAFTITQDDLIGYLDDGAKYRIDATVQDGLGQAAHATMEFEVHWSHQAVMPLARVRTDRTALATFITPIAPAGAAAGDYCDIYRLSVDRPELIYSGAAFGTTYVDPYPTIGEYGGHRIVFRTVNGDYITKDNQLAWIDTDEFDGDLIETGANVINFGTGRVDLEYNIDLSSSWKKDFTETQYLGGSVQGDWNPAISRTGTVSGVAISTRDQNVIRGMRRLATHAGICHVRTKDGSSYPADVQVSESYKVNEGHKIASFTLKVTRVDQDSPDGMTYDEWAQTQGGTA